MKALADVVSAKLRPRGARIAVMQVACAAAIVVGVAKYSGPAGWIAAGVLGFVLVALTE